MGVVFEQHGTIWETDEFCDFRIKLYEQSVINLAGEKIKAAIPVKRLGKPEDVSNAVMFFVGEEASYVTGQVLKVDGGLTLGGMG